MGWFSDKHEDSYNEYNDAPPHEAKLSHELLAGAASYEAAKAYEEHCAENGHPDSHAKAKEIMAGLLGAVVDRVAETKGRDAYDSYQRKRAVEAAQERLSEGLAERYDDE